MVKHLFHPKYRPDIDGLRAIGVLSVVIFHAFPRILQGGFTGVDVFFVISGFLITSIIVNSLASQRFSLAEFYQRRIRRIFPALCTVLVFALATGYIALLPSEFAQLGKHVMAGAGFVANLMLWSESGYFDNASETKPLLHLWSLGIEEQFYIVFPFVLLGLWHLKNRLSLLLGLLILLSFSVNLYLSKTNLVADFYAPYARFWELMLGGMLAIWHHQSPTSAQRHDVASRRQHAVSILGGLLILVGFFTIRSNVNFPGWRALLPTVGAVCILAAGSRAWVNRLILSRPILQKIGMISYPLYLWHWVLLVFLRILKGPTANPAYRVAAVGLAFILAWATYRFIEKPLRFGAHAKAKTLGLITALFILGSGGYAVFNLNGLPNRPVVLMNLNEGSGEDGGGHGFIEECNNSAKVAGLQCSIDKREEPHLALIGDSKAEVLFPALVRTSKPGSRWTFLSKPNFAPLVSSNEVYKKHQEPSQLVLEQVLSTPAIQTIAIASATRVTFKLQNEVDILDLPLTPLYDEAYKGLNQFVKHIVDANKNVVLIIDNPTLADPKDCLNRQTSISWLNRLLGLDMPNSQCHIAHSEQLKLSQLHRNLLASVAKNYPGRVTVFDTLPVLCDTKSNDCNAHMNNRAMYGVTDHISDYAAGLVGSALNDSIRLDSSRMQSQQLRSPRQ